MTDNQQPSYVQREALRIFAAVIKNGNGIQRAAIEMEMAELDEIARRAVQAELQRLFDSMLKIGPDEQREPIPGVTVSRLTSPSGSIRPKPR